MGHNLGAVCHVIFRGDLREPSCYVFLSQMAEARAHPGNGEALRRNAS